MSWSAQMISALSEKVLRPFYLFSLETNSTPLLLWSGNYNLSWDSKTWLGNGWFRGLSSIKINENPQNNNIDIALAGANSSLMSLVLNDTAQSKLGIVYFGLFNSSLSIVVDPTILYAGYFSQSEITDSEKNSIITISLEGETSKVYDSSEIRYTDASQDNLFPNAEDQGLEYVVGLKDKKIYFGVKEK